MDQDQGSRGLLARSAAFSATTDYVGMPAKLWETLVLFHFDSGTAVVRPASQLPPLRCRACVGAIAAEHGRSGSRGVRHPVPGSTALRQAPEAHPPEAATNALSSQKGMSSSVLTAGSVWDSHATRKELLTLTRFSWPWLLCAHFRAEHTAQLSLSLLSLYRKRMYVRLCFPPPSSQQSVQPALGTLHALSLGHLVPPDGLMERSCLLECMFVSTVHQLSLVSLT